MGILWAHVKNVLFYVPATVNVLEIGDAESSWFDLWLVWPSVSCQPTGDILKWVTSWEEDFMVSMLLVKLCFSYDSLQ